jgi:hypothetical protein
MSETSNEKGILGELKRKNYKSLSLRYADDNVDSIEAKVSSMKL